MLEGAAQAALGEFEPRVQICSEASRRRWPCRGRATATIVKVSGPGRASIPQPKTGVLDRREQGRLDNFHARNSRFDLNGTKLSTHYGQTGKPTKCEVIAKHGRAPALAELFDPAWVAHLIRADADLGLRGSCYVAGTIASGKACAFPCRMLRPICRAGPGAIDVFDFRPRSIASTWSATAAAEDVRHFV
jgi:hypothetical protein